ncbi:MAG: threonine synthase [Fibrobacter sp.]|nr:threonine synthase [Fibrobacter sp.]
MKYISTRGNSDPVSPSLAISLGMVPEGGLFVPATIPHPEVDFTGKCSYREMAEKILMPFLADFSANELHRCIDQAYNSTTFDTDSVIDIVSPSSDLSIMELWHGPTAAFKDVALQIMPGFMDVSRKKTGNKSHTVILVATSGDTGKAALEGFRNREGISIIVFYPHGGVSEIQKLQMATTDGDNTWVVAVKGNFDDCQTGVKRIFSDAVLRKALSGRGFEFSSANSINWGRLCPQIVYYFYAYQTLVERKKIQNGEPVNFCVPTGNFGNILAAYYARMMGLPVRKLICASNKNRVLSDFFSTGKYNANREFYRTTSPSMDILISSNLERFLYEVNGHESSQVISWYDSLGRFGEFKIGMELKSRIDSMLLYGWVDEEEVHSTIRDFYRETGYVLDTHTAVGTALCRRMKDIDAHTVIASTASPFKFSCEVLSSIEGKRCEDEFESIERLSRLSGMPVHRGLDRLREREVRHDRVIGIDNMKDTVTDIINTLEKRRG